MERGNFDDLHHAYKLNNANDGEVGEIFFSRGDGLVKIDMIAATTTTKKRGTSNIFFRGKTFSFDLSTFLSLSFCFFFSNSN